MSEDDMIGISHKLAVLQEQRVNYVQKLAGLDPRKDAKRVITYLKQIECINTAMLYLSRSQG
ncbi:MAG: hypothetical protein ACR2PG_14775 [Hyphomicrobiaceae bacterium]